MGMLKAVITALPRLFISIDALDECLPNFPPELLGREFPSTRIFLTGRPYVRGDIQRYFIKIVVIPTSPDTDDIWNYVDMKLDGDAEPKAMTDDLRVDIVAVKVIMENISDM